MFSLTDKLSTEIVINGESYEVDMAFDVILTLFEALNDDDLSEGEKLYVALQLLLGEEVLNNNELTAEQWNDVLKAIFDNYIDGETTANSVEYDIAGNPLPDSIVQSENKRSFSFKQDAEYIYAGFMQCYNIDLHEEQGKLDWRKFIALMNGLSTDTRFAEIIDIRTRPLPTGKGTGKQREELLRLKNLYALRE